MLPHAYLSLFLALANLVDARLASIRTAYNTHVHTSAAPTNPTTPPTVLLPAQASVAATKAKGT